MKLKTLGYIIVSTVLIMQSCKKNAIQSKDEVSDNGKNNLLKTQDINTLTTGFYRITNAGSSKVVGARGASYKDNALIEQFQNYDFPNQKWKIVNLGTGFYKIINVASGKALTVPGSSTQTGVQLQQYRYSGSTFQQWSIDYLGYGNCKITNRANGLAVTNQNSSSNNGNAITQETYAANFSQYWTIAGLPNQSYRDDDVVNFFNRTTGSVAFDQGTSIPLSDGRVLWVTQDAFYQGSLATNGNLFGNHFISYSNSIIIQPSVNNWNSNAPMMTRTGAVHNIGNICAVQPGDSRNWIGPGVEIGNYVYIQGAEGSGLSETNQALYKLTKTSGNAWNTVSRLTPAQMSGQTNINFSTGMVKASDSYVYAYGSKPKNFGYQTDIYLGRFHTSNPLSWTFWDGFIWRNTISAAVSITSGLASNSIAYVNGKYVLCTLSNGWSCDSTGEIFMSYSSTPTGPWSTPVKIYTLNEPFKNMKARYYTPAIHPESLSNNELLITYSLNFGCDETIDPKESDGTLDPYFYRVKGVRVPLSLIGL